MLRFLHFYPSQQKTLAVGKRVRARGEARGGFFGLEMVHPSFKVVAAGTPLADLADAGLPDHGAAAAGRCCARRSPPAWRAPTSTRSCRPPLLPPGLPSLREALRLLHQPAPGLDAEALEDRSLPAWQRLKFDELLAQQLSQLQAKREREAQRAPAFATVRGGLHERCCATCRFA